MKRIARSFALALIAGAAVFGSSVDKSQAGSGPGYCYDEALTAKGPNRCTTNNDCDGARTCSGAGYCQGTSRTGRAACVPPMFYREAARPEVYYQYTSDLYCHVQNEFQLAAWIGVDAVTWDGSEGINVVKKKTMAGRKTGACGWPNGFYRHKSRPEVYRLSGKGIAPRFGGAICHVVNEQQMAAFGGFGKVMVVQDDSDLKRGRGAISKCKNP